MSFIVLFVIVVLTLLLLYIAEYLRDCCGAFLEHLTPSVHDF